MFSKGKDTSANTAPEMPSSGSRRASRAAPSIISQDMTVEGNLQASGDIQVEGTIRGDIHAQTLIVGEKAHIDGSVWSEEVVIRGKVSGMVRARKVQLSSTSHVEGDILHQALAVETGAFFEGNCRHSDDPLNADGGSGSKPKTGTGTGSSTGGGGLALPKKPEDTGGQKLDAGEPQGIPMDAEVASKGAAAAPVADMVADLTKPLPGADPALANGEAKENGAYELSAAEAEPAKPAENGKAGLKPLAGNGRVGGAALNPLRSPLTGGASAASTGGSTVARGKKS